MLATHKFFPEKLFIDCHVNLQHSAKNGLGLTSNTHGALFSFSKI